MKSFLLALLAVCVILTEVRARAQSLEDEDYQADYPEPAKDSSELNNQATMASLLAAPDFCPQCLYDFTGHRVNRGCPLKKQPKCEKGTLVLTSVGEAYEMCCCNHNQL